MSTHKAIASHRELIDHIKKFVAATLPVAVDSVDDSGNPVTTQSADATPAAGEKVIVIRTAPISWPEAKDVLGNTAIRYSNHVIQICTESNISAGAGADILGPAELLPVIVECGRRGHFVEWYRSAVATVPSTAEMTAGNLGATWRDLYWNIMKAG